MSLADAPAIPRPTRDLAQGLRDIADYGLAIVPGVLTGDTLKRSREALYRAAESDRARGREQKFGLDYAHDDTNQRVWNVLSRDPVFEDMAFHDTAVAYVKAVLGWPALLGNISANITGPGGGEMVLHADQIFVPEPWSAEPQGLNVAWCLDDFTEANGATRFVPGSHKLNRAPRAEDAGAATAAMEAEAGSVVVFESRVWHKTGHNRTTRRAPRGRLRLVHEAHLPHAGELVPVAEARGAPVREQRCAGAAGLADPGAGAGARRIARLARAAAGAADGGPSQNGRTVLQTRAVRGSRRSPTCGATKDRRHEPRAFPDDPRLRHRDGDPGRRPPAARRLLI